MRVDVSELRFCEERWDEMAPLGPGERMCARCSRPAVDMRGLTLHEATEIHRWGEEPHVHGPAPGGPCRHRAHRLQPMKLRGLAAPLLAAAALALAPPVRAAAQRPPRPDTLRIHGIVRAADGTPVRAAEVVVTGTRLSAVTDSAGRFALGVAHRRGRRLRLRVVRLGYAPRTISIPGTGAEAEVATVLQPREVDLSTLENRDPAESRTRRMGFSIAVIHVSSP